MDKYDKIDQLLKERKMSRRQLAEQANISPSTLQSAFSRKSSKLSLENMLKITTALQLPLTEIFDEIELWGAKADADMARQNEEFMSKQIDKLSDNEKSHLLGCLGTAIEYAGRYENSSETLQRLSDLISAYGQMVIKSLEMRLGPQKQQQADHSAFLRHYASCIDMLNTHKQELLDATLNFRNNDPELRKLIYGEDESHE